MKRIFLLLFCFCCPLHAATYFLAPAFLGGSDSNSGTSSSTPWLSPNHSVNCGDVIIAAANVSYSAANFGPSAWGTVTCSAGNNVAWLKCVTFDACKISSSTTSYAPAMQISTSYWGVQGWEATTSSAGGASYNPCFGVSPNSGGGVIHHIIYANNVANGCVAGGVTAANDGATNSVDYIAFVGNIAYNAAQQSLNCASGFSVYQPIAYDSRPGTHIYIAGNFSWDNFDHNPCAGGTPSDGEGIIIDTPDGSQGGLTSAYAGQIVVDNNILVANGGRGFEVFNNSVGPVHAAVYARHNTLWGNNGDLNQGAPYCGELTVDVALNVQEFFNIASTSAAKGCGANPIYAYFVDNGDATDVVYSNVGYSASGTYGGTAVNRGFSYGPNNLFGTNPNFANAVAPGAPSCGSASSVPNCMAAVIANFTPTNPAAVAYGYQVPSTVQTYDPLFPQWLCNVNLPPGLVTMGCLAASSLPASVTITGVKIQ